MSDSVNHPAHYTSGDIECIDAIPLALPAEGRPYEDLQKAAWYVARLAEEVRGE